MRATSSPSAFTAELEGAPTPEPLLVPKIVDIHDGAAIYDEGQMRKRSLPVPKPAPIGATPLPQCVELRESNGRPDRAIRP